MRVAPNITLAIKDKRLVNQSILLDVYSTSSLLIPKDSNKLLFERQMGFGNPFVPEEHRMATVCPPPSTKGSGLKESWG